MKEEENLSQTEVNLEGRLILEAIRENSERWSEARVTASIFLRMALPKEKERVHGKTIVGLSSIQLGNDFLVMTILCCLPEDQIRRSYMEGSGSEGCENYSFFLGRLGAHVWPWVSRSIYIVGWLNWSQREDPGLTICCFCFSEIVSLSSSTSPAHPSPFNHYHSIQ